MVTMTQTTTQLNTVQELESCLTAEVLNALGGFSWSKRVHHIEHHAGKMRVHFFSDGLNLSAKTAVENFLHEKLYTKDNELTVYFERKEKAPQPTTASAQSSSTLSHDSSRTHSHSHSQPHSATTSDTRPQSGKRSISGVKRIIAVASGKGGVGKSTVSVNLALSLYNQGYKVGILDADIYGPSIPTMLNIHKDPLVNENNKIIPPEAYGLKVMSFGFFAPEETAVIWRGPMIMKALQQFFWDVDWGELDFLIIDLPPGTGDAQLTLVQSIPLTGAVIVTTPQNVALLDAVKGIAMFRKTEVPILGIVENMSTYSCPKCSHEAHIFGKGGAERVAQKFEAPLLGHLPLFTEIREAGDCGEPLTAKPNHPIRTHFSVIAEQVVKNAIHMDTSRTKHD
jgi:ATP-binding protein involved in chromosome partitioning